MRKRILYCVLDWGLGHATRSIPIIRSLLDMANEVILASDSLALEYLHKEFPSLLTYDLPSYDVKYRSTSLFLIGIQNMKGIRKAIRAEHDLTGWIAKKEKIDAIVSDNRYGCHVPGIPSALVTHQLQFRTGSSIQDGIGKMTIQRLVKPFDHIWVPDDSERTLSGVLSMSGDSRVICIGPQSTLTRTDDPEQYAIAAILSGPEPRRTEFEAEIRNQFVDLDLNCALVRGVQGKSEAYLEGNITVFDVLDRKGIKQLMNTASIILCRSGYSSLMDLNAIGKKAILIPTPGQPEQKYLGERMKSIPNYVLQQQGEVNIVSATKQLRQVILPREDSTGSELLDNAIGELLSS
jgi:glycosyl transferase family 28